MTPFFTGRADAADVGLMAVAPFPAILPLPTHGSLVNDSTCRTGAADTPPYAGRVCQANLAGRRLNLTLPSSATHAENITVVVLDRRETAVRHPARWKEPLTFRSSAVVDPRKIRAIRSGTPIAHLLVGCSLTNNTRS